MLRRTLLDTSWAPVLRRTSFHTASQLALRPRLWRGSRRRDSAFRRRRFSGTSQRWAIALGRRRLGGGLQRRAFAMRGRRWSQTKGSFSVGRPAWSIVAFHARRASERRSQLHSRRRSFYSHGPVLVRRRERAFTLEDLRELPVPYAPLHGREPITPEELRHPALHALPQEGEASAPEESRQLGAHTPPLE